MPNLVASGEMGRVTLVPARMGVGKYPDFFHMFIA